MLPEIVGVAAVVVMLCVGVIVGWTFSSVVHKVIHNRENNDGD